MIERSFISDNVKRFTVKEYILKMFPRAGISDVEIKRTPLGEKIVIYSSRPGLIVGRKGKNISKLTEELKDKFELENPEIEVQEVTNIYLDPRIVAENIASILEKYGPNSFKAAMHKALDRIMRAGARGAEVIISGKVPGARAKRWRVSRGYLKKCGEPALTQVKEAHLDAILKAGVVGVTVKILPPDEKLPDDITIKALEENKEEEEKNE